MPTDFARFFGSACLLAGTAIGAAMLAMPITTGLLGFYPSVALFSVTWVGMFYSALLFLEMTLWWPGATNLISIARAILGPAGAGFCWVGLLSLLYALETAYIDGGASLIHSMLTSVGWAVPRPVVAGLFCAALGSVVMAGLASVDRLNQWLMVVLVGSFVCLVVALAPATQMANLEVVGFRYLPQASSVVLASFGFHIVIPSLCDYLHRHPRTIQWTLACGSLLPLLCYILWEFVTLGSIAREGPEGLRAAYEQSLPVAVLVRDLGERLGKPFLGVLAQGFSLAAILTSFLGVSVSLVDFVRDGFRLNHSPKGRLQCFALSFLVPLLASWVNPRAFLSGLEVAGALGVAVLLGILPTTLVWVGRYSQKRQGPYQAPGGKLALLAFGSFSVFFMVLELINKLS